MEFPRLVVCEPKLAVGALARPVIGERGNTEVPWVAVATGHENGAFILAPAGGDTDKTRQLLDAARANTAPLPWSWQVAAQRGFLWFKRPSLLRAMGDLGVPVTQMTTDGGGIDDLATEVLLNADAMKQAAETLRGPTVAIVVPKRGWLLAAAAEPGDIGATTPLFEAAGGISSRGGRHAVCAAAVTFFRDGLPIGVEVRANGQGYVSLGKPNEAGWFTA